LKNQSVLSELVEFDVMADQLRRLIAQALQSDTDIIAAATEELNALYATPDVVFPLLELMTPAQPIPVRAFVSIGLRYTLLNCWVDLSSSPQAEQLLHSFIEIMESEADPTVRHLFADALDPVFRCSADSWPALFEFVTQIGDPTDPASFEYFMYLVAALLEFLPVNLVAAFFDVFCEHFEACLASDSEALATAASRLCATFLAFVSTAPERIGLLYSQLFATFAAATRIGSNLSFRFAKDISKVIKRADQFESPSVLAQCFIELAVDEAIDISRRCLVSEPLRRLLVKYGGEMDDIVGDLTAVLLHLAADAFAGDCFDESVGVVFALEPLECLSAGGDSSVFFDSFWELAGTETVPQIVAMGTGLVLFMEHIPDVICSRFGDVFDFALSCLAHDDHTVRECGVAVCYELVARNSHQLTDALDRLLPPIIAICQAGHEPAIRASLGFLAELFYVIDIDDRLIDDLLSMVRECLEHFGDLLDLVLTVFSALCESAGESIRDFVPSILPIVQQAVATDALVPKLRGIEALGCLIRWAPAETADVRATAVALFLEFASADDVDAFGSAMLAFRSLARSETFDVPPDAICQAITAMLQVELEPQIALFDSFVLAKVATLDLLGVLMQRSPDLIGPFAAQFAPIVEGHIDCPSADVQRSAIKATIMLSKITGAVPKSLVKKLLEHFEDSSVETAVLGFVGFSRFLKLNIEIEEQVLSSVIDFAFQGLDCELNCATESLPIELIDELFTFLANVAQFLPSQFPLDQVIEVLQQRIEADDKPIVVELIGVLAEFYEAAHDSIQSLAKKLIADEFFVNALAMCDYETPPHPLAAIRCLIEVENAITPQQLEAVLAVARHVLDGEYNGQPYYWLVVANVVSTLLSLVRIRGGDVFDVREMMLHLLAFVPKCLCKSEAENIVKTIVLLCGASENFRVTFRGDLLRIVMNVLAFRDKQLQKLNLFQGILVGLAELFGQLAQADDPLVASIAGDIGQIGYQRLQSRCRVNRIVSNFEKMAPVFLDPHSEDRFD
jgi:hypothetical protein